MYYDEAHHSTGQKTQQIVFKDKIFLHFIGKIELYTSTPVNQNGIQMYNEYDDTKESDYGLTAYKFLYYLALEKGTVRKFNVCLNLCTRTSNLSSSSNRYGYVHEAIIRTCLSGEYSYWNILTYHGGVNISERRASSFVKAFASEKHVHEFKKLFQAIKEKEFPASQFKVEDIEFYGVHSESSNRQELIHNFDQKSRGRICILSSCRTIQEGIDTKWANMVVPVDATQSVIQELQKRKHPSPNSPYPDTRRNRCFQESRICQKIPDVQREMG